MNESVSVVSGLSPSLLRCVDKHSLVELPSFTNLFSLDDSERYFFKWSTQNPSAFFVFGFGFAPLIGAGGSGEQVSANLNRIRIRTVTFKLKYVGKQSIFNRHNA